MQEDYPGAGLVHELGIRINNSSRSEKLIKLQFMYPLSNPLYYT